MSAGDAETNSTWFCSGDAIFPAMLREIALARNSVRLETYIFSAGPLGERFRDALTAARRRGVRVRVLIDAVGSYPLPAAFWRPLIDAGGEVRVFNPISFYRLGIRDHRKLLVLDDRVAFIGGFNISSEYEGDGITRGYFDVGLRVEGELAQELSGAFREMFESADFQRKRFLRLRKTTARRTVLAADGRLLLGGPGRGPNAIKSALRADLKRAATVQIMAAYFLPSWRIRRDLARVARRGGRVRIILAGKSDVQLSRLAAQSLYRRLLGSGVEICEYQPQVLHAKLIIVDNAVYVGSANLDQRSLNINYELMVRFESAPMAIQARELFRQTVERCHPITAEEWRRSRTLWRRIKQRWAYFLLARIDPYIASRQWRALPY
jgi:cardiolipin synthase